MTTKARADHRFVVPARLLHWSMALMVIAQLLIGVIMVISLTYFPLLMSIHRPLGVIILVFAIARLINRLRHRPPPFLDTMRPLERRIATWSERLVYALLLLQPLTGWAMLSAAQDPVILVWRLRLPPIAPGNADLFAGLRCAHEVLAFLLLAIFTVHICAVLFHNLVLRDDLFDRMSLWPRTATQRGSTVATGTTAIIDRPR
ncbi:MAG: cytochrome b/b6 domain-containing protein [Mycobacterium sp.]